MNQDEKNKILLSDSSFEDNAEDKDRAIWNRFFGEMKPGSLRTGIFSLVTVGVGTGCYTMPKLFCQMSLLSGLVCIVLGALAAYWTLCRIHYAAIKKGRYDYGKLTTEALGDFWGKVLDYSILVYILGIIISNQLISA